MPDGGSGMTNDVARQVMLDITLRGDMPKMLRMAEAVDAMTKATRNRMGEYGLLSKKQAPLSRTPHHVPLAVEAMEIISFPGRPLNVVYFFQLLLSLS